MAQLVNADPDAYVLVFPAYADPSDGDEVREVMIPPAAWVHEQGTSFGAPYEVFFPGELGEPDLEHEQVTQEYVRVVLIGSELGNFRIGAIWNSDPHS